MSSMYPLVHDDGPEQRSGSLGTLLVTLPAGIEEWLHSFSSQQVAAAAEHLVTKIRVDIDDIFIPGEEFVMIVVEVITEIRCSPAMVKKLTYLLERVVGSGTYKDMLLAEQV